MYTMGVGRDGFHLNNSPSAIIVGTIVHYFLQISTAFSLSS